MSIRGETFICRPPATVFDFVADERNSYDPTVSGVELLTPEPIGIGTRFRCSSTSRSRTVEMIVEIVQHDRPQRLVTTTHLTGMSITSSLRFDDDNGGTRLRWSSTLQPHGWLRLLTPVLALVGRRQTRAIWTALKHTLESRPDADTPAAAPS